MPNGLETTFIKCDSVTDWTAETTTRSLGTCGKRQLHREGTSINSVYF